MKSKAILTSLAAIALLAGCDQKPKVTNADGSPAGLAGNPEGTKTIETALLSRAVDKYEKEPTAAHEADVEKAISKLNGEIAELQESAAKATGEKKDEALGKTKNLTEFRNEQTARFAKAKAAAPATTPDTRSGLQKLEEGVKEAGAGIKDAAQEAGDKLKDAAQEAKDAAKRAADAVKDSKD